MGSHQVSSSPPSDLVLLEILDAVLELTRDNEDIGFSVPSNMDRSAGNNGI